MSQHRQPLIAIIAVSVIARIGVAIALGDQLRGLPGAADQLSYQTLAVSLIDGRGFAFESGWWPLTAAGAPTAHWSYLYTGFLAAVQAIAGINPVLVRIIQSIAVGVLQPLLAYLLGRSMFGEGAGLAAAALTAIYAYFVYYSATLMTEPFYFTAILASLYMAIRLANRIKSEGGSPANGLRRAVVLGLVLAVAVLLRQVFLLFVPILLLWIWLAGGRKKAAIAALPAL
ncbi:MAG: glycosyltransferase family 39 protein, partial [Anaerolineales bacterium]